MMLRHLVVSGAFAIAALVFASSAGAGSLSSSPFAPAIDNADIAMLNTVGAFDPANTGCCGDGNGGHIWSNRPVQGQTFTTGGSGPYFLNAVTLQNEENTFNPNTATFTVNVGTVVGNVLTPVASESASGVSYIPGDFITMTFDNAIALADNTTYGFDWGTSGGGFTTFNNDDSNLAGGEGYSSGTGSIPDNNNLLFRGIDRVFHADISGTAPPPPPPPPVEPFAAGSIGVNFTGRVGGDGTPDELRVASGASAGQAAGAPGTTTDWNDMTANVNTGSDTASNAAGQEVTVEWTATGTWSTTATGNRIVANEDPSGDMMDGHIEATGTGETTATVSGLADNFSSYDVYVYMGDDAGNRNGEVRFNGGGPINFTSKVFDGTFTEGTDYMLFQDITGDSFTVSVEPQNDDGANRTGIRGIEIHGVPEPSAMMLALIGLLLSVGGIRRRR